MNLKYNFWVFKSKNSIFISKAIHGNGHYNCRNPTLAKCGGEAQHLEKLEVWSPPGFLNVQSSTARPKTPFIGVFLVSLERS
jgi:hypothetical protein